MLKELSKKEMLEINGGDEPGYGIGYIVGRAAKVVSDAWKSYCEFEAKKSTRPFYGSKI